MRWKPRPRTRAASSSITIRNAAGSPKRGVRSLKRIPGCGKSGTSRMRARTYTDLEMQVRARRVPGAADARDRLAALDALALCHQVGRVVRVHRDEAPLVADQDEISVSALLAGEEHLAVVRGKHWRAFGR